ncbi:MAG: Outer membrane protein assembly factor BamD [Bryobacteraceae bacterium]|nr:Outer membrane protein assembly factor BamD [Bryobacteraceae bacterium]MCC6345035.1 tetratricopeptide repeat protein [Bryobacterales bacterium]
MLATLWIVATPLMAQKTNDLIREVQRDLAGVQQDVRTLNSKFDEKIAVLTTLVQQAVRESDSSSKGVAVLDQQIKDSLTQQRNLLAAPVASLNSKIEQMSSDYSALNENVKDMNSRLVKLEGKLNDLLTAISVLAKPPAPPPAEGGAAAGGPPPGATPDIVFNQARRDQQSGNSELAITEYRDFLRFYPNEERAPSAQFHIGEILSYKKDYDGAVEAFDAVLEKYPENNKTPDAMYLKGRALIQLDRKSQASKVFTELIAKYPNTEVARKARDLKKQIAGPTATRKRR